MSGPSESHIQQQFIKWCRTAGAHNPNLCGLNYIFAIPNGSNTTVTNRRRLAAEGMTKGVSDLYLPVPRKGYHGLFLEVKKVGGKKTKEQTRFLSAMSELGYAALLGYGYPCLIGIVRWYYDLNESLPDKAKLY